MRALKFLPLIAALLVLPACFVSETQLLPEGEGVMLAQEPLQFCDEVDSCVASAVVGDGYLLEPDHEGDEPSFLRFVELVRKDEIVVYLGEAELTNDEGGKIWFHLVARAMSPSEDGITKVLVVQPDCNEATAEQKEAFGITQIDSYTCNIGSREDLSAYLIEAHSEDFYDPDWWL